MANLSNIGRGTTIRGSVRGDGDLEILGRVEGSVTVSGELTIGEGALIKSDIWARRIVVRGAVAGNVTAQETLVLEMGARVVGDLGAPQIGIRPGALVRGNVSSGGGEPSGRSRATAAARSAPARAPARVEAPRQRAVPAPAPTKAAPAAAAGRRGGPPPPVVPALKKGARASFVKRKGAR